ncbi:uncharacterized protein LOC127798131 [Diospyros lotus]|uniref:uncharacterized protein LOC127798131 n=1 Tax=Diospyros lotus TaxID=55363 RepID=UPI002256ED48|nr:uncharacterized protein LOC127798131 [Diospyros lotus]XP_052187429.1 uncharacterized protein LOC127798131 [Diospyros lotus]
MGDAPASSQPPDDVVPEDGPFMAPNPDPLSIPAESWVVAEKATREVIGCIHPTMDSDEKRKDVIEYVQRLIRCSLGCEVFPYGSVPLKTYLPDGDIDLTALSRLTVEETFARDAFFVLQGEEWNENAEYEVKDTQFIDAEVKLVKCLVQNIVVDISFNQLGGLCTLCFLEQVDRLFEKDHLFKRSIILIKAWCYYESRILGAHHGLISTYALETLVLYIFHLFHASLNGPLAVLYRFLDYYSNFDWENYCISLKGPVNKSSLPDIVVEMPDTVGHDSMLTEEFLRNCMDMFSSPSRGLETNSRSFPPKNLNIIDPLKEHNNLGRSVHRGNFYRIRSALKYGARKLGQILLLPRERIADEIKRFFVNTLERHGCNSGSLSLSTHYLNSLGLDVGSNIQFGDNDLDPYLMRDYAFQMASQMPCSIPDFYVPGSSTRTGKLENRKLSEVNTANVDKKMQSDLEHGEYLGASNGVYFGCNNHESLSSIGSGISSPDVLFPDDLTHLHLREGDLADISGGPLADLGGDYDSHIRSLLYGQWCYGYASSSLLVSDPPSTAPILPNPSLSTPLLPNLAHFQSQRPWGTARRPMPLQQNVSSQMQTNIMVSGPMQSKSGLCKEDRRSRSRGTGTFIPNSNGSLCSESSSSLQGRGKDRTPGNHRPVQILTRHMGSPPAMPEKKSSSSSSSSEEGSREIPSARSVALHPGESGLSRNVTQSMSDVPRAARAGAGASAGASASITPQELRFGSFGHPPEESSSSSSSSSASSRGKGLSPSVVTLERVAEQLYHLKNAEDFPPLS